MSLEIKFEKRISLEEVAKKTNLYVVFHKNGVTITDQYDNGVQVYVPTCTSKEEVLKKYPGYEIIDENSDVYFIKHTSEGHTYEVSKDKGLKNEFSSVESYGLNNPKKIVDEIIKTFQTRIYTDFVLDHFIQDIGYLDSEEKANKINWDEVYNCGTEAYGYIINEDKSITVPEVEESKYNKFVDVFNLFTKVDTNNAEPEDSNLLKQQEASREDNGELPF